MNKKYGIGFLLGFIILITLFALAYRISYNRALDKHNSQKEKLVAETELCYYIKAFEGYVTVFKSDRKTVYEYTSIRVADLPEDVQKKVVEGIKLTSLSEVYGFLENYSS